MTGLSAPIFRFTGRQDLALTDSYTREQGLEGMLAMTGPSLGADPARLPVRGDLAHIRLAGRYFVPHYAVPMPHRTLAGAVLLKAGQASADVISELPEGTVFNVLDMAGSWSWGQVGEDGLVGYVALAALEPLAS